MDVHDIEELAINSDYVLRSKIVTWNHPIEILSKMHFDEEMEKSDSIGNGQLVVVKFSAEWCGPCKQIEPIYYAIAKNAISVKFLVVDVDECEAIAKTI